MYRILSLDGGGVFGSLSIVLIDRLVKKFPDFIKNTDFIAGTSIGGIVACLIAKEIPLSEIKVIFPGVAEHIFVRNTYRAVLSSLGLKAFYSNENLKKILDHYFGNTVLGDLKKKVLVPAFLLDNKAKHRHWKAKFFHNFDGEDSDKKTKVVDVLMATTAAPVFFPVYKDMVDGSLVENNPSMCAISQTQDQRAKIDPRPKFEDIVLLSMGREGSNRYLEGEDLDWGYWRWINPMIKIALDRDARVVHYQTDKLLGSRYFRLAPILPESLMGDIDAWEIVPDLMKFAEKVDLSNSEQWLKGYWS